MVIVNMIIILCIISGALNASEDMIKDKWHESSFANPYWTSRSSKLKYWFIADSWKNKYKFREPNYGRLKWKVLGLSFNKPVQLTDWWHFSKMLSLSCYFTAILLALYSKNNYSLIDSVFIALNASIARNLAFSLFYNKVLIRNNK